MMLDRSRPYGIVRGMSEGRYSQDGRLFDGAGHEVGVKAPTHPPPPAATGGPPVPDWPPSAPPSAVEVQDPDVPSQIDPKDLRGKNFASLRAAAYRAGIEGRGNTKPKILDFLRARGFTVDA